MWNQFELLENCEISFFIFHINMAVHCPYMQSACKSLVLHICRWGGSLKEFVSQLLTSCDCRLIHFRLKTPTPAPGNIHPQHFRTFHTYEIHWELPKWFDTKTSSSMFNDANEVFYTCIGVHCMPLLCLVMSSYSFSLHICSMCRWILGYRSHKIGSSVHPIFLTHLHVTSKNKDSSSYPLKFLLFYKDSMLKMILTPIGTFFAW